MKVKVKNKVELKRAILISLCIIVISTFVFGIIQYHQYKTYTNNFNEKVLGIIAKVSEKYPNVSKNEIMEILNNKEAVDTSLLREYGINIEEDSIILENEKYFKNCLILNLILLVLTAIVISFIFLKYNHSKDKKLKEITNYIEEINNRRYKLDIEDNTEDELSILKNEIYKTTIMLKEMAENSKQDKLNLKNSLLDISHQLKTPLTSISIMLDNIIDNPEMDKQTRTDFVKDIKREIININFLVNSLLKLSKLDANSVKFVNREETVENLVNESIKNVATLCDLRNVQINVTGNAQNKINCDLKWQVEALTNILKNAIEHSEINSKIEINYEQNNLYTQIEIKDYGKGIAKKDLPHIFERFYKGENSSSESVGIGLALAKSIIESNGGYIEVESQEKVGTTFKIKLFSVPLGTDLFGTSEK